MSLPKTLKGISDNLNIKALLCENSWVVFHEEKKIIFIFQKDGSLIVSQNGIASRGKWEYIKPNKTILIESADTMLLLHPVFVDDVLFILQQDGTDGYIVLIAEMQIGKFVQKTISAIDDYLSDVSGEGQMRRQKLEAERIEKQNKRIALATERAADDIKQATKGLKVKKVITFFVLLFFGGILIFLLVLSFVVDYFEELSSLLDVISPFCVFAFVTLGIFCSKIDEKIDIIEESIINKHLQKIMDSNEIPD